MITNLPTSKVIVFYGKNEGDEKNINATFKVIGGDREPEEEEEDDEAGLEEDIIDEKA